MILLFHKSLKLSILPKLFMSCLLTRLYLASASPENHPAASNGWIMVSGATNPPIIADWILDPDTIYYLIIWDANYMMSGRQTNIYPASEHNIAVELAGSDPIYYTKFDLYIPYIDNGTSWDLL